MNKKGLLGKIIFIVIILVILIVGFTIWQVYSLIKTAVVEKTFLESTAISMSAKGMALNQTDCEKIPEMEASANRLRSKILGACKNPIISRTVEKIKSIEIKCSEVPTLEAELIESLNPLKTICGNLKTLAANQTEIPEVLNFTNITA